jgi:serine protease Do
MKKIVSTLFFLVGLSALSFAQKEKLEDFDEVIIKRKGGNGKVSLKIEIDNDDVRINDKPISSFFNDDVSIKIRKKRFKKDNIDMEGNTDIDTDNDDVMMKDISKKAMLGVLTTKNEKGALIEEVTTNSAAEKMGLKAGDIITKVNDLSIKSPDDLIKAIQSFKPNDQVTITYLNEGKTKTTKGALGAKTSKQFIIGNNGQGSFDMKNFDMKPLQDMMQGLDLEGFGNGGQFKSFGMNNNTIKVGISAIDIDGDKGIKITKIADGSPAAKAGLKVDDIITEIDKDPIFTTKDLRSAIRGLNEGEELNVKYKRAGKNAETKVFVPKKIETIDF